MLYAILIALMLLADQGLKYFVMLNIPLNTGTMPLIPGVVHLTHVHNYGCAFGLLDGGSVWARIIFLTLTAAFCVLVIWALSKKVIHGGLGRISAVLVLGGALGNCFDRLVYGFVVDMFEFEFVKFAVGNPADWFITIGGILFCLYILVTKDPFTAPKTAYVPYFEDELAPSAAPRTPAEKKAARQQAARDARAQRKAQQDDAKALQDQQAAQRLARMEQMAREEARRRANADPADPFAEWRSADDPVQPAPADEVHAETETALPEPSVTEIDSVAGEEAASLDFVRGETFPAEPAALRAEPTDEDSLSLDDILAEYREWTD